MDYKHKSTIINWNPEKGFGFMIIENKKYFVHVSVISPYQERGVDLLGFILVVYATEESSKGLRVTSAATLKEHENRLLAQAEKLKQEENRRLEEESRRIKQEANEAEFRAKYPELLNALIEELPKKLEEVLSKELLHTGLPSYFRPEWSRLAPWDLRQEVNGIIQAYEKKVLEWARECLKKRWNHISQLVYKVALEIKLPQEIVSEWLVSEWEKQQCNHPYVRLGDDTLLPRLKRDLVIQRQCWITEVFDTVALSHDIKTVDVDTSSGYFDTRITDESNGWGTWICGVSIKVRKEWCKLSLQRIFIADEAAGYSSDIQVLVEKEIYAWMMEIDIKSILTGRSPITRGETTESNLFIHENKVKFARLCLARWAKRIRKEQWGFNRFCPEIPETSLEEISNKGQFVKNCLQKMFLRRKNRREKDSLKKQLKKQPCIEVRKVQAEDLSHLPESERESDDSKFNCLSDAFSRIGF